MTLVERMAKAMYERHQFVRPWDDAEAQRVWGESMRLDAIAALKAMREPPFTAYADADALNDTYWPGKAPVHAIWQAMIDQAIKEGGG